MTLRSRLRARVSPHRVIFGQQVIWSLGSRVTAAVLQVAVIGFLARGLGPAIFARAMSANAALMIIVALNGFGLMRQIQYRRSLDPRDPRTISLFERRLVYSYVSAISWAIVSFGLFFLSGDPFFLALLPAAVWLLAEQITQVWNALSVVDGEAHRVLWSYIYRRTPVLASVVLAGAFDIDLVLAWTTGMAVGAVLAWLVGRHSQETWARTLRPSRLRTRDRGDLVLWYWVASLGVQVRELEVPALLLASPVSAGLYALPSRLMTPMQLVTEATATISFPRLARLRRLERPQLVRYLFWGSLPTVVLAILVVVGAPLVPLLVGSSYASSVPILQVLAVGGAIGAPASLLKSFLEARSLHAVRWAGIVMLSTALVRLAVVAVVAIRWGPLLAALGASSMQALTVGLLLWGASVEVRRAQESSREAGFPPR